MSTEQRRFFGKFCKYLPMSGEKRGSALQASISKLSNSVVRFFIEMAPQTKAKPKAGSNESPFDWDKKIFISLKEEEVGKILALFSGRTNKVDVIHKFPIDAPPEQQRTTILSIGESKYNEAVNWFVRLKQTVGNNPSQQLQIFLQPEDVEILIVMLRKCIEQMYNL